MYLLYSEIARESAVKISLEIGICNLPEVFFEISLTTQFIPLYISSSFIPMEEKKRPCVYPDEFLFLEP